MTKSIARSWVFTSWEMHDWKKIVDANPDVIGYVGVGEEICKTTGRKHQQGFLQLRKKKRMTGIKKFLCDDTIHLEVMRGSLKQNATYCGKEGNFQEIGEWLGQGRRTDLQNACNALKEGATIKTLWKEHTETMVKYEKGMIRAKQVLFPVVEEVKFNIEQFEWPKLELSKSTIIWGEAGIGKTEFALSHFKSPLMVSHLDTLKEFDEEEHDGIVFDDMSFIHLPRESQIHLVDNDKTRAIHLRYINATIPAHTKKIFTTNVEDGAILNTWDAAIMRRINLVHLTGTVRD